jgi:ribosome-associated toxin RatA of RatAB toxin-antitoxin module
LCLTLQSQTWKSYTTSDNLEVEYLRDNQKKMFFVKIKANTNQSIKKLLNHIHDVENYNKWVSYTVDSKIIASYGEDSLFYYTRNQPPFPLNKKDAIFSVYIDYLNDGSINIYSKSCPNRLPIVDGYERVDYYIVEWSFIPKREGTSVYYYLELEYPSMAPEFILSQFIRKGPEESVRKFLKM